MPPKSIFRQPGVQHFELVHRSQRDPLINDPDAPQHVLKPITRENLKKGKSKQELEQHLSPKDVEQDRKRNVGEASAYGVYFDDTEYDYMQHLKPYGVEEEGVDSVLIEAEPQQSQSKQKKKGESLQLRDLPPESLASTSELPQSVVYESHRSVATSLVGFQPDMNPHLRQTLEALEDDAFVDDDAEDDFFGSLVQDGERDETESLDYEFDEYGVSHEDGIAGDQDHDDSWEARFAKFKKEQRRPSSSDVDSDERSEGQDTVRGLPEMSVIGGKRRGRKGTSDASGYSMSSSSMFRTEALLTLDERFDQMMIAGYDEESEDTPSEISDSDEEAPELITSRVDFENMMDDFLGEYEILGRKMKRKLAGDTGADKLDTIRRTMGIDERVQVVDGDEKEEDDSDIPMPYDIDEKKDRWDCETILTTYSNLENHPRLIRARDVNATPKIRLDRRTGLPTVAKEAAPLPHVAEGESDEEEEGQEHEGTIIRPRDESKEDKKARKDAVKEEQRARRAEKKSTKEQFAAEYKRQKKAIVNKEKPQLRKL
ncbi:Low temperature viability protein-domain-containing protein [Pterulicium gracile]|uniref:Low temperature viability protein-domain-containing protein n=1 Tax=Pterulicium gracile TaxID=1884261 RepID=A0A5C3R033_9AGAR|nr:Low temperature viability protein-domain-containing protein [Pterula gracilis]